MADLNIVVAFLAGILSFLSPCILPIIPGFIAYLSGSTGGKITRTQGFLASLFFVIGFSTIFALLGVLLNTALSDISYSVRVWLGRIGGLIIMAFAIHILGIVKIPFLMMEHKIEVKKTFNSTYFSAFLFGAAFAVGWSPCVGAILGSIFALAVAQPGIAFVMLMSYALGLGIPFLIVGVFTTESLALVRKSGVILKYFNIVVGILLLILGILVFTDYLSYIANFLVPVGLLG